MILHEVSILANVSKFGSLYTLKALQSFSFLIVHRPQELFNWLLVIEDRDYDQWDQPRISWHVKYQRPLSNINHDHQADQEAEPTELDIEEDSLDDLHHMVCVR